MEGGFEGSGQMEITKSPSAEILSRQLRVREGRGVSRRFVEQRRELLATIVSKMSKAKENDEKTAENNLQLGLAFAQPTDDHKEKGKDVLNKDEHQAYFSIIGEILKSSSEGTNEQEVDRSEIFEIVLQNPQVFQAHYDEWKNEYGAQKDNKKFKQEYPHLEDYVQKRGHVFIDARKKDMIVARVTKAKKQPKDKTVVVTNENLEDDPQIQKVWAYLDKEENYENFLTYGDLNDEAKKDQIYNQFVQECGLQNLDPGEAKKLFDGIAGDAVASYIAHEKYSVAYVRMMEMVDYAEEHHMSIDPDTWDAEIERVISQNATGALKESIERTDEAHVYKSFFNDTVDYSKRLEKPQDVANLAGVILVGRGVADADIYIVRYPYTSVVTRMKIIKKSKEDYEHATFAVYDPHPDSGKDNWAKIDTKQDLRSTFNKVFLGSLMYTDAVKKKGGVPNEEANMLFNSEAVTQAAKVLYKDKALGDIFITPQRRLMFENLLAILMKPDQGKTRYGDKKAFATRLKVIKDLYGFPNKLERLRQILAKESAGSIHTLSTLLAVIDQPS